MKANIRRVRCNCSWYLLAELLLHYECLTLCAFYCVCRICYTKMSKAPTDPKQTQYSVTIHSIQVKQVRRNEMSLFRCTSVLISYCQRHVTLSDTEKLDGHSRDGANE